MAEGLTRAVFVVLVGLVLGGCGSSGRQVVHPDYHEKLPGRPTLGILPLGSDLMAGATAAPTPLTRRGHSLFYRLFGVTLTDLARVTVLEAGHDYEAGDAAFAYRRLGLSKSDTIDVPVPVSGPVRVDGRTPAFLLLIDDLKIFYGADEGRQALGTLVTSQLVVSATCEYVLWDNQAQQLVGYGRLEESAPTEPGANPHGAITLLFQRLGLAIVRRSPFVPVGMEGNV